MRPLILALFLPALAVGCSSRENYLSFVDYFPGSPDTKVILTAPHDGWIRLESIPDRRQGCYDSSTNACDWRHDCSGVHVEGKCNAVTNSDLHSSVLAKEMRKTISELTGETPHLVVSRLHRSKLDPNRFMDDAAQYNSVAERAYKTFHGIIKRVHNILAAKGPAVHFDIHGYVTHAADNWTEIGYNIRTERLNANNFTAEESSLRALAARAETRGIDFDSLVRGEDSLGRLIQEEEFRVVPSPEYPRPDVGKEEGRPGKYFRGGYITRKWGSLEKGEIDAVQIEFPQWVRDRSDYYGPKLGRAMATWIQKFYPDD